MQTKPFHAETGHGIFVVVVLKGLNDIQRQPENLILYVMTTE